MLQILLAAGALIHHPPTVEGRVSLLEARQMLDSQQIWTLRSQLPPEALKAIGDLQLHVQHDQEQEDKVRELSETVQQLQQRLAALELALADRAPADSTRIPVAPMQLKPLEVPAPTKSTRARKPKRQ
ncbi:MAG TPA: hypothetical protein VLW85_10870 [Myxococcales bacterium]|nr:hypothetical protein [Myxococcales bacterium]